MGKMLLAAPVLLPLVGGAGMMALHFRADKKEDDQKIVFLTEGLVLANSLILFWLLKNRMGTSMVLFRLFGNLTVQFKLDQIGRAHV